MNGIKSNHPKIIQINRHQTKKFFEEKVLLGMPDGCHYWIGDRSYQGYGYIIIDQVRHKAHRVSYELYKGKTDGFLVCHWCDNPTCVNPDHLFLGTYHDNTQDKCRKGRQVKGIQCSMAKLDAVGVQVIREARNSGFLVRDIACYFNVHRNTIGSILSERHWKHIK